MQPTLGNGKICYIEMPAKDAAVSANFYAKVFGWSVRTRGSGAPAFDDGVGQVSGAWRTDRPAGTEAPGILIYIMVTDMEAALSLVAANGGVITQPVGADHPEITARFKDPAGNVLGLYQES